jgi:hypothetical protein
MRQANTAATARVLMLIDAVARAGTRRVSDLDLTRLAYFVDAFSPLWGLAPLDRYRAKVDEVRSDAVRQALNRLVFCGVVEPSDISLLEEPRPHVSARYRIVPGPSQTIFEAIYATAIGRREAELVEEVVYAAAALLDGNLDEAIRHDAAYSNPRIGPADVIDLARPEGGTTEAARRFRAGASSVDPPLYGPSRARSKPWLTTFGAMSQSRRPLMQ